MNDKSKSIIKMVEHFEHSVYGEQMETWSPRSTTHHHLIIHRINKILNELGYTDSHTMELELHKKIELIAHNLGISFWEEDSSDSEDDGNILDAAESPVES